METRIAKAAAGFSGRPMMVALLLVFSLAATQACENGYPGGDHAAGHEHSHDSDRNDHAMLHDHDAVVDDGQPIGVVDFQADCTDAAQQSFDRALALMHHMMYVQARESFEGIVDKDPDCAMAHWGVATTLFQPLWGTRPSLEDRERGWAAISEARDRVADADRERALIEATAAYFRGPSVEEFGPRLQRWADGMAEAYANHGDDLDVAALYGLSRLTIAGGADDPDALYDETEALLRQIWREESRHPGAIHYMIHATDVDGRARNALDMVEVYAQIAPDVPHALHMPSHIHVRLGDWPEVINWNRRSAKAALENPAGDYISHHYIHAQDYLLYAHLQRGEDEKAREVLEETFAREPHQPTIVAAYHAAVMPARMAVERRDWDSAREIEIMPWEDLAWDEPVGRWSQANAWLARGMGHAQNGDLDQTRQAYDSLRTLRRQTEDDGERAFADYIRIEEYQLAAWLAWLEDDQDKAIEHMYRAVELEADTEKHPITPGALIPPSEGLGELYLAMDRPEDALEAFERSDRVWPARYNTLLGAARAAEAAGKADRAERHYEALLAMIGDADRSGIREAKAFLQ